VAVFFTSLDRDAGVGWVGQRSFWRPQTAFCPFLGMVVFNQPPHFLVAASGIRTGELPIGSLTLCELFKLSNLTVIADWKKLIFIGVGGRGGGVFSDVRLRTAF
jgi:hypothetical protein